VYPLPRWFGRSLLLGAVAWLAALLPPAAWGQGQRFEAFNCQGSGTQAFQVPVGVTALNAVLHGAHGGNPGNGAAGGFGGLVQATLTVTPGQQLRIWVGCHPGTGQTIPWGFGIGGNKGGASNALAGDGGLGGGGSAVTAEDLTPLLVAGGGGGGGGSGSNSSGGTGGTGGIVPEPGRNGTGGTFGGGGDGGCGGCAADINGGDGTGSSVTEFGGGGGLSFAESSATAVFFGTSTLAADGLVVLSWPAGAIAETDGDSVPDVADQCEASDLSSTVMIDACDAGVENDLDVDGCMLADRIAEIAAAAANHGQFVRGIAQLTTQLQQQGFITRDEKRALLRCAVQADIP
jgi:hypothetical protein